MQGFTHEQPGSPATIADHDHLERPFQVKIVNGTITRVTVAKDEPLWTGNLKRGLAAQLQLQLDSASGIFTTADEADYYADNAVYHAMEGIKSSPTLA